MVGLTTLHTRTNPEGLRPRLSAGSATSARGKRTLPRPDCPPFWFMPISLFGMLPITTAQQRFTFVGHILQPQLPTALRLAVATSPRGSVARLSGGGDIVPGASHPGVTPNARPGRVPVAEHRIYAFPDKYACDLVSHVPGRRRRGRVAGVAKGRETRSQRRQHAERVRDTVKPFAKGVAKPEQLLCSELVAKPLPERGVPGQQRLSPRSESVRRQEPPAGFTSDTRHSCFSRAPCRLTKRCVEVHAPHPRAQRSRWPITWFT